MRRREFVFLTGVAALWPLSASAQRGAIPRLGYLSPTAQLTARDEAFRRGLAELGYVEGENILVEYRFAKGDFAQLPALAAELVALDVDIIVSVVTQASLAARDATGTIPIVMVAVNDPVGSGLVESLARPDANITGTSSMTSEVVGKSLEALKEVVPSLRRVAVLWNPSNAVFQGQMLKQAEQAAEALGLEERPFEARGPDDLEPAFAAMEGAGVGALLVLADPTLILHQKRIIELADRYRLPTSYGVREIAEAGGLMAYGPDINEQFRRAATYVDRILKGAEPVDLPIEQPTLFELSVNLKTAKTLGLSFPLSILSRADEVIE